MFNNGYTSSDGRFKASFQQDKVLKGEDGFSPIVEVEEIEDGHRIHITDKENTYSFDVMNGEVGPVGPIGPQGEQGIQGPRGEQGYTPYIGTNGNWWVGDTDTGIFTNISVLDVVELPTKNINEGIIYRLLEGKLYLDGLSRNDCNCSIVKWGENNESRPSKGNNLIINAEIVGSSIIEANMNVYYNIDNKNLYGYFDEDSVKKVEAYVDQKFSSVYASAIKSTLKFLVSKNRWISITQILTSSVAHLLSFRWRGVVGSLSDMKYIDKDSLYLCIYSTQYSYKEGLGTDVGEEGVWIKFSEEPIRTGEGKSSFISGHIKNIASGDMSAAFGNQTQALGSSSIAAGYLSVARNNLCFAFGEGLDVNSGFTVGQYNEKKYSIVFSVGVGTSDTNRKNALDIQSLTGNINFYTPAVFNSTIQVKDYISFDTNYRLALDSNSLYWQYWAGNIKMISYKIINEVDLSSAFQKYRIQTGAKSSSSVEANSTAEGINNVATGLVSHAEGAETQALGVTAHSEGYGTQALADYSHAEGLSTEARGIVSHAEGGATIAEGPYSHTEGQNCSTTIEALWAHAEGVNTVALAMATHTEGNGTIAASYCQHVQGQFNLVDEETKYAHIVGKGADDDNRSNAHTLDWNGNAWFAGAVLIGGESMDDENAELLITSGVLTKLLNKLSEKGIDISIDELLS